jgi:hypothetical protein
MNSEEQRAHWDLKYEDGLTALTEPDPFFISAYGQFVDRSFPNAGVALDLAGGLGRHAREDAGGRLAVSFSLDRVGCGADIGIIGRNDADAPPKPLLPTTMEIGSPPGRHFSCVVARSYRCNCPSTAFQLEGVTTTVCVERERGSDWTKEDGCGFHQEQV